VKNKQAGVLCLWCHIETDMTGTQLCDRCWELEHRIERDLWLSLRILINAWARRIKGVLS